MPTKPSIGIGQILSQTGHAKLTPSSAVLGRRQFVRSLIVGGGATVAFAAWPASEACGSGHADALLLSCMDYRLVYKTGRYMTMRGLQGKYDHVVLAGASLGAVTDKFPDWNSTFWEHLRIAIDLHKVSRVIVIDHRDCGAYKLILGEDLSKDPAKEKEVHASYLRELKRRIKEKHSFLRTDLLLMNLNGKVETIT